MIYRNSSEKGTPGLGHNRPPPDSPPVKMFSRYSAQVRKALAGAATKANGNERRLALGGEFVWVHSDLPGVCFPTKKAARQALKERDVI